VYTFLNKAKKFMRRLEKQEIRKIYKHNQSYALTLPIGLVRELGWQERQKVTVKRKGNSLIITDWEE
jgi:antitoxin component of MazEF toxin-antitoxin module